jgi:hypothetical protein
LPVKNSDRSWQQLVMNMCFQIVEFNIMIHRKSNGWFFKFNQLVSKPIT